MQSKHMSDKKLWHQARNIVIAFCVIVLALTSSSLWLNGRHGASDASDDSVKSQTQEMTEPSASEAAATASASASTDQANQTQPQETTNAAGTEWRSDPNVRIEEQDGMTGAVFSDGGDTDSVRNTSNAMAQNRTNTAFQASTAANTDVSTVQTETNSDVSDSTDVVFLSPEKNADSFAVEVGKFSGNRLIIGGDSLSENFLSTNTVAGYDSIWIAAYDNETDMQSDYKNLKAAGYDAVPDMSVQVCDNEHIERSWLQKLKTMIRRILGSLIYAEDERSLSEQMEDLNSSNQTVVLLDTGDNHAEAAVNLTKGTLADNNGHGTEMDSIIREKAGTPVNVVSIKTVNDDGKGRLSDLLTGIMLAKTVSPSAINISLSSSNEETADVVNSLIAKIVSDDTAVVAAAGNQNSDASNYVPGNASSSVTVGAADENGNLQGDSNYGTKVNYYIDASSTSKAAAQFTGMYVNISQTLVDEEKKDDVTAVAEEDPVSPSAAATPSSSPVVNTESTGLKTQNKEENTAPSDGEQSNQTTAMTATTEQPLAASSVPAEVSAEPDDTDGANASPQPSDGANSDDEISTDAEADAEVVKQPVANVLRRMAVLNLRTTAKAPGTTATADASDPDKKHATGYIENLDDDDEYIEMFKILEQEDGLAPFDSSDDAGYDSGIHNGIVRTNDSVDYTLQFTSAPYTDGAYYRNGYIRFKFILPNTTSDQAEFATEEMSWMVSGTGTDYDYNVSSSTLDGKPVQILTCAMKLSADASGVANVLPCVKQTAFVRVRVKDMKSGSTLTPKFYCWMDHNTADGVCSQHGKQEVAEATAAPTTISARPAYDVSIGTYPAVNSYKTLDFNKGTPDSPNYGKGNIYGAWFTVCTGVMMRNTGNSQRGLRGIEYPTGDITFDIELTPSYYQESTKKTLTDSEFTSMIQPYVYYADLHKSGAGANYGRNASVSGLPFDQSYGVAPSGIGNTYRACYDGGKVTCSQDGNIIHVTVKDYKIDGHYFPYANEWNTTTSSVYYDYHNYGKGGQYTNYGFFSTQDYAIGAALDYDAVEKKFGEGSLQLTMTVKNAKFHSVNGESGDIEAKNNKVMSSIPVRSKGVYDNNVFFEGFNGSDQWEPNRWSAQKADCIGSRVILHWGMTLHNYNKAYIYGFDSLVKFDAKAFTPTGETIGGYNYQMHYMFAAKKDGTDWSSEEEKEAANIDDMDYYSSYKDLVASGKKCVGFLTSARTYASHDYTEQYYSDGHIPVIISTDDGVAGNAYHIVEVSNVYCYEEGKQPANLPFYDEYLQGKSLAEPTQKDLKRHYVGSVWEDGEYKSGGNHAMDTGDTLYVMSYMAKITKHVEQTSDNAEKTLFNLDNGEKIVDYILQPSILSKLPQGIKSELTITDVIPKGMIYNNDSVYGGAYIAGKTSGAHGSVDGGTAIQPSSITTDNKGQTVITWIMKNVDLSSEIPAIHYSATVDADKAVNNQSYTNTVIIRGQGDKRAASELAGNYAYSTIKVVKLSGFSLTKLPDKEIYEVPDDISWTMTWNNLSKNAEPDILMMDMMPYNSDSFGTDFHGSYTVKSLKLDLDDPSKYEFYYTTDESYRGKSTRDVTTDDARTNWKKGTIQSDGTVNTMDGITPVAWGIVGTLNGNTSLQGHITIQTTGARPDDDYYNASSMMKAVVSGHSAYVSHNLAGYVFIDANKDGLKNGDEKVLSGVVVTLYKKGDHTTPVKNIDGKECVAVTDEKGHYEFSNISKADYDVVFTKDDLGLYSLTPKSQDSADWTNKATHEADNLKGIAQSMYIDNAIMRSVETQQRDVLSRITYRTDYLAVNLGVYPRTSDISILKMDENNNPLSGAELVLTDKAGKAIDSWTSGSSAHKVNITWGEEYVLKETKAPAGKSILSEPVTLRINEEGTLIVNGAEASDYKIVLRNSAVLEFLRAGGKGIWGFTIVGLIIMVIGAKLRKH